MKFLLASLLLSALLYAPLSYSMDTELGVSACVMDSDMNCKIAWDLSQDARNIYRLERFDPILRVWAIEQDDLGPRDIARNPATPGYLYRVLGCDLESSNNLETDCISTTVTWAPVMPDSADKIPERVYDNEGTAMGISKRAKLRSQTIQLNVYLMTRDLRPIDLSDSPRMAEPGWVGTSTHEVVRDNVSSAYNAMVNQALGIPADLGPRNPRAGVRHDEEYIHPHPDPDGQ